MNQHEVIKKYIEGLTQDLATSLLIVGKTGTGKTELTIETLKKMGYQQGIHYRYVSNYISPVELFNLLRVVNDLQPPKLLILDDLENTLQSSRAVGLLRTALWEVDGQRKVNWFSNTYLVKEREFKFEGKIIFLLNHLNLKSAIVKALKDRALYLELDLSLNEMLELMSKRAEMPYRNIPTEKRREIFQFIKRSAKNGDKITLRTLPKIFNLFLLSPNHYKVLAEQQIL